MGHKNSDQLELIGKLLDLPIEESWEHGARYKLNDFQEVFVRLMGAGGGKGYASISPRSSLRRGSDSPWFTLDKSTISIYFSEGKAPEKIAQDIKRRLLNSPYLEDVTTYTRKMIEKFNERKNAEKNLSNSLKALKISHLDVEDKNAHYNHKDLYINARLENGSIYFDHLSIDPSKAAEVIEAIIKIHEGE
jgi:hypothetical protein